MNETKLDKTLSFPERTVIFRENDFSKDIYIIQKGLVNLYKKVGSKNILLYEVGAGGMFGEMSIIDNGPRSATAVAIKETKAIQITAADFRETTKNIPDWFMGIARVLAQRLRATDKKLNLNVPAANEANVCAILIYLLNGAENSIEGIKVQDAEQRILELLSISIGELSEILENLGKKGIVNLKREMIGTDAIFKMEDYLEKLRKSLTASVII